MLGVSHLFVGMQLISVFGHQLFSGMCCCSVRHLSRRVTQYVDVHCLDKLLLLADTLSKGCSACCFCTKNHTYLHIIAFPSVRQLVLNRADFGDESVVLGLLLVLLAELLGTGVFLMNIDTVGRRVLLLSGTACVK